ncbi:MAG: DUF86 domain-containing protein [Dehalococcoidia bacterium]
MSRDWRIYLEDILNACRKVRRYTAGMTLDEFQQDEKSYDAVVRNLEVVGEAAKRLPDEIKILMPNVEWRKASGLRDILAHAYFGIDDDIIWDVIQNKVPEIERAIETFNQRPWTGYPH